MNYANHEEFALNTGVELVEWPVGITMQNPSKFGTNVKALEKILDHIEEKKTRFRRIPDAERRARQAVYDQKVQAGEAPKRKKRSDAGTKRGKRSKKDVAIDDAGDAGDAGDVGDVANDEEDPANDEDEGANAA